MSIYQDIILDNYKSPKNFGKIENPTASVSLSNPLCGDKITLEVVEKNGKVKEIAFFGEGCVISTASASLLTEYIKNKSKEELKKLDKDFIIELLGVELSPNRLKCALLPLEALHKILE